MEMLRQGRDSTRMREIGTLHRSLSMFQIDRPIVPMGVPNTIYVSIPGDALGNCVGLPLPPPGWEYRCVSAANLRNINGTGWIPIDFTVMPRGSPLASLPVDPVNTVASGAFYAFVTDGRTWTLASLLESEGHAPSAARDGGTDFARFEAGNNLALWTSASGLVGYWSFDEGTGTTARDLSGRGNAGTLQPTLSPPTWTEGRVGRALSFDGADDFVNVSDSDSLDISTVFTIAGWHKRRTADARGFNLEKGNWDNGWDLAAGTDGSVNLRSRGFGGAIDHPAHDIFDAGQWVHLVITYNSTAGVNNLRFYKNGVLKQSLTETGGLIISAHPLRIGRAVGGAFFTNGLIDEVRIYNRALSAAEIRTIFNATR